jgi:hypothetical protein
MIKINKNKKNKNANNKDMPVSRSGRWEIPEKLTCPRPIHLCSLKSSCDYVAILRLTKCWHQDSTICWAQDAKIPGTKHSQPSRRHDSQRHPRPGCWRSGTDWESTTPGSPGLSTRAVLVTMSCNKMSKDVESLWAQEMWEWKMLISIILKQLCTFQACSQCRKE